MIKRINILIIEDELRSAKRINRLCDLILLDYKLNIDFAKTFEEASTKLSENLYDLTFLDLNLNGKNGYELLQLSNYHGPHCIVVSAYAERAIEAFEYGVIDFLRKPLTEERFQLAINRFLELKPKHTCKYLAVRNYGNITRISVDKIKHIKAQGNYSEISLENNEKDLHEKSLNKLEQILPDYFLRIHKSYIVNINLIKIFKSHGGSQYSVELKSEYNESIPVGRKYVKFVKSILHNQ